MIEPKDLEQAYEEWRGKSRTATTLEKLQMEILLAILERLDALVERGKVVYSGPR